MDPALHDDVRAHRDWLLSLVPLPAGGTAVDLGCGRGEDLLALAALHPDPASRFVGIDASESSIHAASVRAAGDPRLAFRRERLAGRLPLEDASVDAVFSHNLLECLADRAGFAREAARILRPGGTAVVAHWDFDSQLYDGPDRALVRRMVHAFADWKQPWMEHADGWMGRRLHGVFARTGLFQGTVHARMMINTTYAAPWYGHARAQDVRRMGEKGLVDAEDADRFIRGLEALEREGRYVYGITGFAFVGRRLPSGG